MVESRKRFHFSTRFPGIVSTFPGNISTFPSTFLESIPLFRIANPLFQETFLLFQETSSLFHVEKWKRFHQIWWKGWNVSIKVYLETFPVFLETIPAIRCWNRSDDVLTLIRGSRFAWKCFRSKHNNYDNTNICAACFFKLGSNLLSIIITQMRTAHPL